MNASFVKKENELSNTLGIKVQLVYEYSKDDLKIFCNCRHGEDGK